MTLNKDHFQDLKTFVIERLLIKYKIKRRCTLKNAIIKC